VSERDRLGLDMRGEYVWYFVAAACTVALCSLIFPWIYAAACAGFGLMITLAQSEITLKQNEIDELRSQTDQRRID
jgi:hypothetical protein